MTELEINKIWFLFSQIYRFMEIMFVKIHDKLMQ